MRGVMVMRMVMVSMVAALLVMGCATSYQTRGITGGYSDKQVAPDEFMVMFEGNGFTTQERCNELALVHAADVTINNGFNYFEGLDMKAGMDTSYMTHPGSASTYGRFKGKSYVSSTFYSPPSVTAINRPTTYILIKCYTSDPGPPHTTFDARKIKAAGAKKYGIN